VAHRQFFISLLLVLAAFAAVGCEPPAEVRAYDVELTNHLSEPVTVFFTKNGPPDEYGWLSPEQMAENPMSHDPPRPGQPIPPGSTGRSGQIVGHFWPNTSAILRVYRTTGALEDFAALSFGNLKRLDLVLHPGLNRFVVVPADPGFVARREEP